MPEWHILNKFLSSGIKEAQLCKFKIYLTKHFLARSLNISELKSPNIVSQILKDFAKRKTKYRLLKYSILGNLSETVFRTCCLKRTKQMSFSWVFGSSEKEDFYISVNASVRRSRSAFFYISGTVFLRHAEPELFTV